MVEGMDSFSSYEIEATVKPQEPEFAALMDVPKRDSSQSVDDSHVTPLITPQEDTWWVISLADYCKYRAEEKQIQEMEEAMFYLIDTVGYQYLPKGHSGLFHPKCFCGLHPVSHTMHTINVGTTEFCRISVTWSERRQLMHMLTREMPWVCITHQWNPDEVRSLSTNHFLRRAPFGNTVSRHWLMA